jgi:anti-anti-sigma factor
MMNMTVASDDGEVVTVMCDGDITQVYFQLGNPLEKVLGPLTFSRKVILDLEKVSFLDSSGLSWLVACHKRFQQLGGRLVLCAIPPHIHQVLQFCRIDSLFGIAEDQDAARTKFEGQKK